MGVPSTSNGTLEYNTSTRRTKQQKVLVISYTRIGINVA